MEQELASLQKEIEAAKAELKILTAKRFESINFMNELKYRESNLKRKYAELGLNYE